MIGQKSKANSSVFWGDWDTETVRLDFDNTMLDEVLLWSYRATFFFKLEGFLISARVQDREVNVAWPELVTVELKRIVQIEPLDFAG